MYKLKLKDKKKKDIVLNATQENRKVKVQEKKLHKMEQRHM